MAKRTFQEKISNIETQKRNNLEKIKKLYAINILLDEQIEKLRDSEVPKQPSKITEDQKAQQREVDKAAFQERLKSATVQVQSLNQFTT